MVAVGIVFLYNRKEGSPEEVSKKFSKHFSDITENLVKEDLLNLVELKEIMDTKPIYWGGIKKDFNKMLNDNEAIGAFAWNLFKGFTKKEASEDVEVLIYDGLKAPWGFTILVCVLYQ
ncbi:MAG TPA: hypothetical protein VGB37_09150 [Candidatus Lokiarchaeia archaeon]